MPSAELGLCEWFVWDVRRSDVLDFDELDLLVTEFLAAHPAGEPAALARFLVDRGALTEFQAKRLMKGKGEGLVLGRYTLLEVLGSGSTGTVFKARSKDDGGLYAVKVLPRRNMWNVRIAQRQVRAFENWRHPAVAPFVDVGTAGGAHYLVWPFVQGITLQARVEQNGKLSAGLAASYALQIAEGLGTCHAKDLVHGVLKPSNVMVGDSDQVCILDFGIGALLANADTDPLLDTMSASNALTRALDCASPECAVDSTKRTPAGDQYSLGCVLYFALTGQVPFPGGRAPDKIVAHQTKQPPPIRASHPDTPPELDAVVVRLMQKKPENRCSSNHRRPAPLFNHRSRFMASDRVENSEQVLQLGRVHRLAT